MNSNRARKLAVSLWIVLSLFVSTVSACTCAHDSVQTENHCQLPVTQHLHDSENSENTDYSHSAPTHSHESSAEHHESETAENFSDAISPDECCCFQSAPRVFAKSETVKIEKQSAAVLPYSAIDFQLNAPIITIANVDFAASFYLSDSFYNLKSPRAPPRS